MRDGAEKSSDARSMAVVLRCIHLLGTIVTGVGVLVIVGWLTGNVAIKSVVPGLATMKLNTALLFMLLGLALVVRDTRLKLAQICATVALVIAIFTLAEYAFGLDFRIDELLIRDEATRAVGGVFPGRMSVITAVNFTLLSISLLLLKQRPLLSQLLTLFALSLALVALATYLYDAESLRQVFPFSTLALHTAGTFVILGVGILLTQRKSGVLRIVFSDSTSGIVTRRLLPVAILLPIGLGWLLLQGQLSGLFNTEFGVVLFAILSVVVLLALSGWIVNSLDTVDNQRLKAEESLQQAYADMEKQVTGRTEELVRTNENLEASEAKFAGVINTAHDAIISVDEQQRITLFNQGATRIFGYEEAEVMGQPLNLLLPDRLQAQHNQHIVKFGRGKQNTRIMAPNRDEVKGRRKNGEEFPADVSISSLVLEGTPIFTAVVRDVSERQEAKDALEASEQRFRLMVNNVREYAIIMLDPVGNVASWNEGAQRIKGYTEQEIVGQHFSRFYTPEDVQSGKPLRALMIAEREGDYTIESWRVRQNGTKFWARVVLTALHNDTGELIGFTKVVRDLTERQEAEIRLKEYAKALEQSNKELESFAYTASHDLQEPLRKIQAFGDRLQMRYGDTLDESGQDYLRRMINASTRMRNLIQDLLTYSRVTTKPVTFNAVVLNDVIRAVCSDLEVAIEDAQAQIEVDPLSNIEADKVQIRQLFQNLISNAIKFRAKDRPCIIRISGRMLDTLPSIPQVDTAVTPWYELVVADNGIGFENKYADRILGIFQRLHGRLEYEGTGIGLAICQKIVTRHHGTIAAHGTPDQGATFTITLPVQQDQLEEAAI